MILAPHVVPSDWTRHLQGGLLGIGYDVATTINKTSNPSSITVTEDYGGKFWERLIVRFKSEDPEAPRQILDSILSAADPRKLRSLCIDSSNEKYHARNVRTKMRKFCPVYLIASGEKIKWDGTDYLYKTLLGQLYVSAFEDGRIALPDGEWVVKDHRLVKNHAGSYATETDDSGNHGDTFDSGKLSLWSHLRGARGTAEGVRAMAVGGTSKQSRQRKGSFGNPNKRRLNA
jgi:hypothetical protein